MMISSIKMWKEVLNIRANANAFEHIKKNLKKQNENIYQDWKQKNFDLNYTSHVKLNNVLYTGATLLSIAVLCGNLEIIKYLIDEKKANVQSEGGTVLCGAAENGYLEIVKYFVDEKNIDVQSRKGIALHSAAANGHLKIVKYTIEKGLGVNVQNGNGRAPLHSAAANGHLEIVKYLIEIGANIHVQDEDGRAPLHSAAANGHLGIVKYLIEIGADIHVQDRNNRAPLHLAAQHRHVNIVRTLIDANANVNLQDKYNDTPLHLATYSGNKETMQALIDANANVDLQGRYNNTTLHLAAYSGNEKIMQVVIDANANVDLQDYRGNTPLCLVADIIPHSYDRLLSVGKLLIAHEVKLKGFNAEKPGYLQDTNSKLKRSLSKYWDKCLEIKRMKEKSIDGTTTTLYDILTCKNNELVCYARKGILQRALENDNYRNEFPIHANDLKDQYTKGTEKLILSNEIKLLSQERQELFFKNDEEKPDIITALPMELLEAVITHLENVSMKNLKKALEINMQHQR